MADENDNTGVEQETDQVIHQNGALTNRLERLEQNNAVLQLLQDPDVAAVVQARRAGKKIQISEVTDEGTQEPEPEPSLVSDLADDDPTKDTLAKIEGYLKTKFDRTISAKDKQIEELNARLAQVEGLASEVQKKEIKSQVDVAKSKYKDFDQYGKSMVELSQKNPDLGVEDLYILAKHRAGKLRQAEQATFSERPSSQPRRTPQSPDQRKKPISQGRKGFSELLAQSLSNLQIHDEQE